MPLAGMAAGSSNALQELLARAFQQKQAEQQMALRQAESERQQQELMLQAENQRSDQEYRTGQVARQGRLDERQVAQDDIAAADRRQEQNQRGVTRMIGDFVQQRGATPLNPADRQQIAGMAVGEGVMKPDQLLDDPGQPQRERIELENLRNQNALGQIAAAARNRPASAGEYEWVLRGNQPVQIRKGTAQLGDRPYDPVADRQNKHPEPGPQNQQALALAKAMESAKALKTMPGKGGAVGAGFQKSIPFMGGPLPGTDARSYQEFLQTLRSQLTLPELSKMKGTGPLSDRDLQILAAAATPLSSNLDEGTFDAELEKTIQALQQAYALASGGQAAAPPPPPGGAPPAGGSKKFTIIGVK